MYTCPKCGHQSADDVRFCPKCGTPAAQQQPAWQQPQQPQQSQQQLQQYSPYPAGGQQNPYAPQPNMGGYRPAGQAYGMVQEAPKKKNTKVIALSVAVILLVVALAGTLIALFVTRDKNSDSAGDRSDKSDYRTSEDDGNPNETPSKTAVAGVTGSWSAECDLSEDMWNMVGEEFDFYESFPVTLNLEVNKNGTLTIAVDEDALRKSVDTYLKGMIDAAIEAAYQEAATEGISRSEFDKQVQEYYGMSLQEYVESMITADMLMDEITNGTMELLNASYQYEDGRLYIAEEGEELTEDSYWEVILTENQLTITAASDRFFGDALPLVFTRK